jgi:type VI secretion system protein ImpM
MPAAIVSDPPGWFGKLPALGDFASRRLPDTFVSACDTWLQAGLREGQDSLGARWLPLYLQAAIVRFQIGTGVVDSSFWQGVLMPSVDRVGRYFPLIIAAAVADPGAAGTAAADAWFKAVEDCAIDVLDPNRSVEEFEASLALVSRDGLSCDPAVGDDVELRDEMEPPQEAELSQEAKRLPSPGESLWWDPEIISVRCEGLPAPQQFVALLTTRASSSHALPD